MKPRYGKTAVLVGGLLLVTVTAWAQRGPGWGAGGAGMGGCVFQINSLPKQTLDGAEAKGLLYMREEEKLARDVYAQLYADSGSQVFARISQSEQRHFDAIKVLMDRYGLSDPAADRGVGVFSDNGLQTLYNDLVQKGKASPAAAFRVGATIEDIDIRDLDKAIASTDNLDLKLVYRNLANASRYHVRAFVAQLGSMGETYSAQYISASALAEILSGTQGNGRTCAGGTGNCANCAGRMGNGGMCNGCAGDCSGNCLQGTASGTVSRRPW